jgi:peptidoglycan lytic transglycosylase G
VVAVLVVLEGVRRVLPDSSKPAADPHGPYIAVVIPSGTDASGIGDILEQDGVVADGGRFRDYAKEQGEGADFQAGRYRFRAGTDYDAIIKALDAGQVAVQTRTLVIPEGFRISEIANRVPAVGIPKQAYLHAVNAARPPAGFGRHASMEGFMFPATYTVRPHETAQTLVSQQLGAFGQNFAQVDMSYARSKNLTPYDVLTIASMIEREAHVAKDRPLIAAVIYNRLHLHMTLGIDATLLYEYGSWTHQLTQSELDAATPYNTRKIPGLPPTPICNPGLASLQAAAHPAHVDYLYYVAKGDGTHYFTSNYDDFLAHGG